MMYDASLALRNLRSFAVTSIAAILVIGMALGLAVTVTQLSDGVRQGIISASNPFGVLVIGPKGSAQQLVLNSLLLQGLPLGNIPRAIFDHLQQDSRVAAAIPLAMGDNVGGARIIGTTPAFFELRPAVNDPPAFQLAEGRLFAADDEVVLGAMAARQLGLKIGDKFQSQHGVTPGLASDTHDMVHTVIGILKQANSPYDHAVFTSLESVIHIHAQHEEEAETHTETTAPAADDKHAEEQSVTAILVLPRGFVEANQIWQEFYVGTEAQAVFPGQAIGDLLALLRQGQQLLNGIGLLTAVMAALTLFLTIYSATQAQAHLLAIMRSVGARRINLFRIVLFEALFVALLGAASGRLIGYLAAVNIGNAIARQSALPIPIRYLPQLEGLLWLGPLLLAAVAGLLPALQAYRTNPSKKLFSA